MSATEHWSLKRPPQDQESQGNQKKSKSAISSSVEKLRAPLKKLRDYLEKADSSQEQDAYGSKTYDGLRYYQIEALKAIFQRISNEHSEYRTGYVEMATGTGKTETFAKLIEVLDGSKTLIIVPSTALVGQTKERLANVTNNGEKIYKEGDIGTFYSGEKKSIGNKITVITTDSLRAQLEKDATERQFAIEQFDVVVADEAHRILAKKVGSSIVKNFNVPAALEFYSQEVSTPASTSEVRGDKHDPVIIGFTATPSKEGGEANADGEPNHVKQILGPEIYQYPIKKAIEEGYLSPFRSVAIEFDQSSEAIKELKKSLLKKDKDGKTVRIDPQELAEAVANNKEINEAFIHIFANAIDHKTGKATHEGQTIIFAHSKLHAELLEKIFKKRLPDVKVGVVHGGRHKAEIDGAISDFKKKKTRVLINVDMISEGVDLPVENILQLSPTRSWVRFWQRFGRGLRKPDPLLFLQVDFDFFDDPRTVLDQFDSHYYGQHEMRKDEVIAKELKLQSGDPYEEDSKSEPEQNLPIYFSKYKLVFPEHKIFLNYERSFTDYKKEDHKSVTDISEFFEDNILKDNWRDLLNDYIIINYCDEEKIYKVKKEEISEDNLKDLYQINDTKKEIERGNPNPNSIAQQKRPGIKEACQLHTLTLGYLEQYGSEWTVYSVVGKDDYSAEHNPDNPISSHWDSSHRDYSRWDSSLGPEFLDQGGASAMLDGVGNHGHYFDGQRLPDSLLEGSSQQGASSTSLTDSLLKGPSQQGVSPLSLAELTDLGQGWTSSDTIDKFYGDSLGGPALPDQKDASGVDLGCHPQRRVTPISVTELADNGKILPSSSQDRSPV